MLQRGFPLTGINFDAPGAAGKNIPPPKGEGYFLVLQRGFPLTGINFDSPGATEKNIPRRKAKDIFWCSSGDSNPNRIARFQCLLLSDNTFDNFLLRFTYRLTLLCTSCLRLSSRSV